LIHEKPTIFTGDFNCRVDTINQRTNSVIEFLEREGFRVMNKPTENTYVAPSLKRTVDLIFLNCSGFRNIQQAVECEAGVTPQGKHNGTWSQETENQQASHEE
jgi:hypothetical protein